MKHWNEKHGQARPGARGPTYRSWECMKARCNNPNDPSYRQYGGRGIAVCSQWQASFASFLADMGERPKGTSLDRIDVSRGYEPSNCRWADGKTQASNKTNNRMVEFDGQAFNIRQLSEYTGVPYQRLHERIVRRGWDVARAVNEPPRGWK